MDLKSYFDVFGITMYVERDRCSEINVKQEKSNEILTSANIEPGICLCTITDKTLSKMESSLFKDIIRSLNKTSPFSSQSFQLKVSESLEDIAENIRAILTASSIDNLLIFSEIGCSRGENNDAISDQISQKITTIMLPSLKSLMDKPELKKGVWEKIKHLKNVDIN